MRSASLWMILLVAGIQAQDRPRVLVQGHRGARASRPENTLPAFRYAIAQGVDALELDMAVTKDNVLVISHDPALHPPVCTGPEESAVIRTLTLAEVERWDCGKTRNPLFAAQMTIPGTRMPTLDDVFQLAPLGTFDFNIETKSFPDQPQYTPAPDEFARMVLDKIRRYKLEKRVIVQSFDFRTLVAMRKLAPEVRLAALTSADKRDFAAIAADAARADIVSPEFHLVTGAKVKAAHQAGLQVIPWTVNKEADWEAMIAAGVDAIITDDPAALIGYLRKKGLR